MVPCASMISDRGKLIAWASNRSVLIIGLLAVVVALGFAQDSVHAQEMSRSKAVGRIEGRVRLESPSNRPRPLTVNKNHDFCGAEVPNESLLIGPEGGVQNAVIIIRGLQSDKSGRKVKTLILDNKNCAFVPHVQVAPVGSEILILNSDPILHDAHARMGQETLFNVGLPSWRQVKKRLTREGIVKIECDVLHTWQSAYIFVTSSRYSAVTDKRGKFIIERVPAGRYDLEFWHEKLGKQRRAALIEEAQRSKIEVTFFGLRVRPWRRFCETLKMARGECIRQFLTAGVVILGSRWSISTVKGRWSSVPSGFS